MAVRDLIDKLAGNAIGKEQQEQLREYAKFSDTRLSGYQLAQNYYDGKHKTRLLSRAKLILESNGIPYAENYCETVIDTMVNRMRVTGFEATGADAAAAWMQDYWESPANATKEFQGIVHTNTTTKGDGFVAVGFSEMLGKPTMAFNQPELCEAHYDDEGNLELIVKCWETTRYAPTNPNSKPIRRMNLHYPDRVEKYFAVAQGDNATWSPHRDEGDKDSEGNDAWPVWTTDNGTQDGAPLGISIIHFRNKAKGASYGRSEIRGAIPMQDAINKQCEDLFYVMDAQGWPVRYGTGVPDDQAITIAIGELLKATSADARFGQFDPADPRPLCEAIEASLRRFAIKTATPVGDLIASASASGESKKMDIEAHIAKVNDRNDSNGGSWSKVASQLWIQQQVYGDGGALDLANLPQFVTVWDDPQPRNEQAETEMYATQVRDLGLSKETALTKLGYDGVAESDKRAKEIAASSAAADRAFNAGAGLDDNPFAG